MKIRVYFLIVAVFFVFHLPLWEVVPVLVGYYVCERFDRWLNQKVKDRIFEEEMGLWKPHPEDPTMEVRDDGFTRPHLDNKNEIVVMRIAQFIWRLH